jgi:Ca-activated chloride channel family protein
MSFVWPQAFLLLLVPGALVFARTVRRSSRAELFEAPQIRRGYAAGGRVRFGGERRRARTVPWRLWVAFALAVAALARPQWVRTGAEAGERDPGEIVIALDLSRSMLSRDVGPSRLERARGMATQLAATFPDRRIGLIGFAGAAHVLAPPSEDRALLHAFLPIVGPQHLVTPGTDFAALLDTALVAFGPAKQGRALVILSDGEAQAGPWRDRIAALQRRDIHVVSVGIGTAPGAQPPGPDGRPMTRENGDPVISHLSPGPLATLASATHGQYLRLARAGELAGAVRAPLATGGGRIGAEGPRELAEQFAWFAAAALLFLGWSTAVELPARARLGTRAPGRALQAAPVVAASLVIAVFPPGRSHAAKPLLTATDLQGEKEPLLAAKETVAAIIKKRRLGAADYLRVVEVATRYGEIHRGHGHPLQDGVLRDGLAAVDAGRHLDPHLADWGAARLKLERLLVPPPPIPNADPGPADPANEPLDARLQQPQPGQDAPNGGKQTPGKDEKKPTAGQEGLQDVGGSQKDDYDPGEWKNAALIQPLDLLQRIRRQDSPAEVFRRMQAPPRRPAAEAQTW